MSDKLTEEEIAEFIRLNPFTDEQVKAFENWEVSATEHWERLDQTPHWKYRESKLPAVQYFLRFDGNWIKKYDIIPKLIAEHAKEHPNIPEVRMIFKPSGNSKFDHSTTIDGLRRNIEAELEKQCVDWRLRELYRFNNDGFHYTFTAGNQNSTNWINHGIILIFTPFGVADI